MANIAKGLTPAPASAHLDSGASHALLGRPLPLARRGVADLLILAGISKDNKHTNGSTLLLIVDYAKISEASPPAAGVIY
jgi:hypothetical protein